MVAMTSGSRRHQSCQCIRKNRPENGFTLLEVMVALAVVAIALMAVYRMHTQTLFMDARGRFDTVAAMLARQQLADIDTTDLTDLTGDSGDFGDTYPGYAWRIQSEDVASDLLKADGPILKRITVTISRNEGESQFDLTTYRHLYE
jgi:general secretion pathway protein I